MPKIEEALNKSSLMWSVLKRIFAKFENDYLRNTGSASKLIAIWADSEDGLKTGNFDNFLFFSE